MFLISIRTILNETAIIISALAIGQEDVDWFRQMIRGGQLHRATATTDSNRGDMRMAGGGINDFGIKDMAGGD